MPTKKELNDEANDFHRLWGDEQIRRRKAEAALADLVAAAEPLELLMDRIPTNHNHEVVLKRYDRGKPPIELTLLELRILAAKVSQAREPLG